MDTTDYVKRLIGNGTIPCPACKGKGWVMVLVPAWCDEPPYADTRECDECNGSGYIKKTNNQMK